jgi:hypothetical protein
MLSGTVMEIRAAEGNSPVREKYLVSLRCPQVARDPGNSV